eukprot:scaffold4075_cov63-Cylindrotheca_fusiformis.AAC.5
MVLLVCIPDPRESFREDYQRNEARILNKVWKPNLKKEESAIGCENAASPNRARSGRNCSNRLRKTECS